MVTGQALVLFSRLNIVVQDLTVSHRVLAMIIINAIVLHIPSHRAHLRFELYPHFHLGACLHDHGTY